VRRIIALAAIALFWQGSAAMAASSASVTPGSVTASLASTLPVTFTWSVTVTVPPTGAAPPTMLTSPQGLVSTPGGEVLQVITLPLTVHLGAGGQGFATETVALSPATIRTALQLGVNTLLLSRSFGVKPLGATAAATIHIGGGASGALALSRVSLHFEDRSLVRVLRSGDSAVAVAEINYTGSGVLNGLWEVAAPPSTQGEPVFVPVASTSVNLASGGLTEVSSPALPATLEGSYYVRFRIRSPVVPFTSLLLRYAVEGGSSEVRPIEIVGPRQHATLDVGTHFEWQPSPDAVAYRLEFYEPDPAREALDPICGQWVPSSQRDAVLSALARTHLEAGRSYRWRIIALSTDSRVVARSAFYDIRTR
jgi:hypothetical protein